MALDALRAPSRTSRVTTDVSSPALQVFVQQHLGTLLTYCVFRFTLIFDSFVAQIGPSVNPSEWRHNCRLLVQLHYPQSFKYSILQTEYRGFVSIDAVVTGWRAILYCKFRVCFACLARGLLVMLILRTYSSLLSYFGAAILS